MQRQAFGADEDTRCRRFLEGSAAFAFGIGRGTDEGALDRDAWKIEFVRFWISIGGEFGLLGGCFFVDGLNCDFGIPMHQEGGCSCNFYMDRFNHACLLVASLPCPALPRLTLPYPASPCLVSFDPVVQSQFDWL